MEEIILNAFERTTGAKKLKDGYVAGVIYGDTIKESTSVKFEEVPLKKLLAKHGSSAKLWLNYKEDKKYGFIKEIQRHPVTNKIIHIDVQIVSKNHEIKMQLPISFRGEELLSSKMLTLQIHKSEIDVFGKMELMPDSVSIDVSAKELGDTITIKDFVLDQQIKITDKENEIYAAIVQIKKQESDEAEEEASVKPDEVKAEQVG
jgi:large subunit ribosomal protein L25